MSQPRFSDTRKAGGVIFPPSRKIFRSCIILLVLLVIGTFWLLPCAAAEDNPAAPGDPANITMDQNSPDLTILTGAASDTEAYAYDVANKGVDCFNNGNYACAWESLEDAHSILPNDTAILDTHAYLLAKVKKYDEALGKIDAAIALDPGEAYLWYEKGTIQNSAGKYLEAGQSFDRAQELDPSTEVSLVERFPLNFISKNVSVLVLLTGFVLLGIYIYFRERQR